MIALDGATNSTTVVPVGISPYGVAVNPVTNKIYVANNGSNNVTVIDGATNATTTVAVGTGPTDVAVNQLTSRIYVVNELSNNVTVIDGATNSTSTVATGTAPRGIAVNPVTNKIYVGSVQSSVVTVIDGITNTTIPVATGVGPWFVTVNPVTNKAYASNYGPGGGGASVTVISEAQAQPVPLTVAISPLPNHVATSAAPSFTLTPTSTFSPVAPAVQDVFYQIDTWQGSWTSSAPSFTATTGPLQPGLHTLYAFAVDAQAATSTQAGSPLVGRIAAYPFLVNPAATVEVLAGTPQSAVVNTAFGATLQAKVTDAFNQPLSGVQVTFSAPASGAGGTFAASAVVTTNAAGLALAPAFTANAISGAYAVTATAPGVATPAVFTLTNLALTQTISFAALVQRTYGDVFSVSATATSGLALSFASTTAAACVVSGTTVRLVGVGTCSITASQAGNVSVAAAPSVTQSFIVNRAVLAVAAQDATKPFGAPLPPLQVVITGFVNGDSSAVLSGSATAATTATESSAVGSYPITVDPGTLAAANYSFSFQDATLTIVRAPTSLALTGLVPGPTAPPGQAFTLTFTVAGAPGAAAPAGTITYSIDGGAPQTAPVTAGIAKVTISGLASGTHTVSASYGGDGNYLASASNTLTLSVAKVTALLSLAASPATTLPIGQSFTIAMVLTPGAALPAPTGTIAYAVDSGSLQTVALASGRASVTISGLFVGSHTVAVNYSGDANYLPAGPQTLALTVSMGTPVINSGGLVSAGGFNVMLSPGGLGAIFGTSLAGRAVSVSSLPLPTTLGGVQVLVNGIAAPLLYVSPTQINFQVPFEAPAGSPVTVQLVHDGKPGPTVTVTFSGYAPAVFTYQRAPGQLDPVIVHTDNTLVTPSKPAAAGEILTIYATGAGSLNNAPASGVAAPVSPLATTKDTPTVAVGGASAAVLFSGLTPGFVGLLQINIQLPATLPAGTSLPLVVAFPGASSAPVNLWVKN